MKGYGIYYNLTAAALVALVNTLPAPVHVGIDLASGPDRSAQYHVACRRRPVAPRRRTYSARPPGSGQKLARKASEGKLGLRW